MKKVFLIAILSAVIPIAAQQNWAAIPCFKIKPTDAIGKMFVDSLHNEIILNTFYSYQICNTTYKGIFAYNGYDFHNLDLGIETHNPNPYLGSIFVNDCIAYDNKTLFGGGFLSVGSNTLYAKSIALWNGAVWDTFPTHCFSNNLNGGSGGFCGFLKHNGKLWMYGGFDTIGTTITKNLVAYDGNTFTAVPPIPVNNPSSITKMVVYKNKLIATGSFYDYPSFDYFRLAQFDGTNWAQVGNGVQGGVSGVWDMKVYNDTLYIAGAFPKSAGNAGNYIMKWDGNQLSDAGFGDFCGYGPISKLIPFKNRLYAFGGFMCAANQKAFGVAYYENGAWTVPQDSIDNGVMSAVLYNDAIYIGGHFKSINGDTSIQKFAKLICPDFDAASGCISAVGKNYLQALSVNLYPNPVSDNITVEINEAITQGLTLTIFNLLGQQVYLTNLSKQKHELNLNFLSPGVYYLKVNNHRGQRIIKLVKENK